MKSAASPTVTDRLFPEISLNILLADKTSDRTWWLRENGSNWWNRKEIHSMEMLYYIVEGCFRLKVDDTWYTLQAGDLVYIPADKKLEYFIEGDAPLIKYYIHFNVRIGHMRPIREFGPENILKIQDPTKILSDFEAVLHWNAEEPTDYFSVCAAVMRLLSHFSALPTLTASSGHPDVDLRLTDAAAYMTQHYAEKLRVGDLADRAGFTPDYFGKKFRQRYGCSPISWLNRLRIQKAQELLAATDLPVADIAEQVGLNDSSYFSRLFKETTGLYPVKFRHFSRANQP